MASTTQFFAVPEDRESKIKVQARQGSSWALFFELLVEGQHLSVHSHDLSFVASWTEKELSDISIFCRHHSTGSEPTLINLMISFISHTSKVMLKILQARLQQYMNRELPDVQAGLRKGRGTRDQIANIQLDHWKSKRVPEKHLLLLYWLCKHLWLCGSPQTVENSSRDGNTRRTDLPLEKSVCRSQSNSSSWTWNNRLVPNRRRSTSRLYIVTLLI